MTTPDSTTMAVNSSTVEGTTNPGGNSLRAPGIWLAFAATTFWLVWFLMPGVGVTDTDSIFFLVGAHRARVFASVVLQLLSSAAFAPAVAGLLASREARASGALRYGGLFVLLGAMGSAADAIFHLVAFEMTAPGVDPAAMRAVMQRLQGPDLALLVPFVVALFVGEGALVVARRRSDAFAGVAFLWLAMLPVVLVALVAAHGAGVVSARAVGLSILAVLSGSTALTGVSFMRPGPARRPV